MRDDDTPAPPCPKCDGARSTYYRQSGVKAGKPVYYCPACYAERGQATKAQRSARWKHWYVTNRQYDLERSRRWQRANPGRVQAMNQRNYARHVETIRAQQRRYRQDNTDRLRLVNNAWRKANPDRVAASIQRWQAANQARVLIVRRAASAVRSAIKRGLLQRPSACDQCNGQDGRIEAAHHDYSRPLDVRWLCASCHRTWDRAMPKTISSGLKAPPTS